ncbi:MAG: hypothetical protein LAN84_12765 [Acidobacteriia bacterium]|nr:hypothetical protein [Terriglobia bacterium]
MRNLWHILTRIFFWSYERGAWQYDVAVAAILVFVLLTPRHWFHDQPQVGIPATAGHVALVSSDAATRTYRVDARVLAPPVRTPELSSDLHKTLQLAVPELRGRGFEILRIEAARDADGTVTSYEVQIRP